MSTLEVSEKAWMSTTDKDGYASCTRTERADEGGVDRYANSREFKK